MIKLHLRQEMASFLWPYYITGRQRSLRNSCFVEHHIGFEVINFSKVSQLQTGKALRTLVTFLVFEVILFSGPLNNASLKEIFEDVIDVIFNRCLCFFLQKHFLQSHIMSLLSYCQSVPPLCQCQFGGSINSLIAWQK